ncbi:unnamed protein product [Phytomonas sp. Hart1]|nr:unnamed protein product [Phytomonas sp. Hart1]|eukprot:CCW67906.1 unnamed protein product [Phytomonas sp. isolate Hart1]
MSIVEYMDHYGETIYDGYAVRDWLIHNADVAMFVAGLYLTLTFKGAALLSWSGKIDAKSKPLWLRGIWTVWNLLLSGFSLYGTTRVTPVLLHRIRDGGLHHTLCTLDADTFYRGRTGMAIGLFALSKGPEFIDSILLLLSGKPGLSFQQWFHHVTTFLFTWHAYAVGSSALQFAAVLNYTVHTIMYFYFALAEAGLKALVRPFAVYITILQILQMVLGTILALLLLTYKLQAYYQDGTTKGPGSCSGTTWSDLRLHLFIVVVNLIMFMNLFIKSYFSKPRSKTTPLNKNK